MLDLTRATACDKLTALLHHLKKCFLKICWWDSSSFNLAVTIVIIMNLVAFSTTNMHTLATGHLMQAWAGLYFSAVYWL